jgi:flagellar basal body-associated protein FliL
MLVGLALFAAGAGGAVMAQTSALASAVLTLLALAAWVVGACAMIGYVRWYFRSEVRQVQRDQEEARRRDRG